MNKDKQFNSIRTLSRTIKMASTEKSLFIITIILTFTKTGLQLLLPYIFSRFFDYAQINFYNKENINNEFILLLIAYLFVSNVQTIVNSFSYHLGYKWWLKTQTRVFYQAYRHINKLSLSFFEENPTGKIRERIWSGSQAVTNVLSSLFNEILPQLFFIFSSIIILFNIKPIFSIIILVVSPIYFFVLYSFNTKQKPIRIESRSRWEKLSTIVTESILHMRTVKTNAREDYHEKIIDYSTKEAINEEMRWSKLHSTSMVSQGIIIDITRIAILFYGLLLVTKNQIQIGTFILIWTYTNQSIEPIARIARIVTDIQKNLVEIGLTFKYLDTKPLIADTEKSKNIKIKDANIEFENITFGYNKKVTFKNLSLTIPQKSVIAIVGQSGSGKTTLIKLLLRLYEPQKGEIKINDKNIQAFTQKSLRENISVVMQDSVIFNDTVLNNIMYSKLNARRSDVITAAKLAGADKFINSLPDGYNTILGERGVKLSGGEQQRINIARAFLKNAPILILDEATSSLDSQIELEIQKAMWKLTKDRTTIIIAHRLSTVMRADLIVVMDKGKIVETGTHKDLVEHKGIYSKLFEIQSGGYLSEDLQLVN